MAEEAGQAWRRQHQAVRPIAPRQEAERWRATPPFAFVLILEQQPVTQDGSLHPNRSYLKMCLLGDF